MPASRTGSWGCWGAHPDPAWQPMKMHDGEVDLDARPVEQLAAGEDGPE